MALKIAASAKAGGELLQNQDLIERGTALLNQLHQDKSRAAWYCPKSMGMMLTALSMLYPRLSESPWSDFWQHLGETWHRRTCAYIGPAVKEWQHGYEPQVTLYDMFLGYFSGGFSERALKINPAQLEAVLIPPCDDVLVEPSYPLIVEGKFETAPWDSYHGESTAYCIIENGSLQLNPSLESSFHPFRFVWGDRQRVHTFVCQSGNGKIVRFSPNAHDLLLSFELGETIEVEDREKSRDVIFYMDAQENMEFLVSGHKSSTFKLGEPVSIDDGSCRLELIFTLEEGEGRFLGHRMLGNRPSQLDNKGSQRFRVYDWQVFLRTVGRAPKCRVNVSVKLEASSKYASE